VQFRLTVIIKPEVPTECEHVSITITISEGCLKPGCRLRQQWCRGDKHTLSDSPS